VVRSDEVTENVQYLLYTGNGQIIRSAWKRAGEHTILDAGGLVPGIYFVQIVGHAAASHAYPVIIPE
jgi:hypothetical protein